MKTHLFLLFVVLFLASPSAGIAGNCLNLTGLVQHVGPDINDPKKSIVVIHNLYGTFVLTDIVNTEPYVYPLATALELRLPVHIQVRAEIGVSRISFLRIHFTGRR